MFKHKDLEVFDFKFNKYDNFHPLEIVGRGSETHLQVGENLEMTGNKLILWN